MPGMNNCAGLDRNGNPCYNSGLIEENGKLYCRLHVPSKSKSTELAPKNNSHYPLGLNYGLREAEKPEQPLLLPEQKIRGMSLARFAKWCQLKDYYG